MKVGCWGWEENSATSADSSRGDGLVDVNLGGIVEFGERAVRGLARDRLAEQTADREDCDLETVSGLATERNAVGEDELRDACLAQGFHGHGTRLQDRVDAHHEFHLAVDRLQDLDIGLDGTATGDFVVEQNATQAVNIADDGLCFGVVIVACSILVDEGVAKSQQTRNPLEALDCASITEDESMIILGALGEVVVLQVVGDQVHGADRLGRGTEETLDMVIMRIQQENSLDVVGSVDDVGEAPSEGGNSRLILLVRPGIGHVGEHDHHIIRISVNDGIEQME